MLHLSLNVLRLDKLSVFNISLLSWKGKGVGTKRQRQRILHLQGKAAQETWRTTEICSTVPSRK